MNDAAAQDTLPEIEGIDQLDAAPVGSRPFTREYFSDSAEDLIAEVRGLPARSKHCIVPRHGWPKRIYRKPDNQ